MLFTFTEKWFNIKQIDLGLYFPENHKLTFLVTFWHKNKCNKPVFMFT